MLVGICGKAGAGKDTIGDYLIEKYGFKKISLADPLKKVVKEAFVLDDHTVYDREAREKELERWPGWSVRKLLQYVGTELFREHIDNAIWVKNLWYKISDDRENNYVVTDIRFPNELEFLERHAQDGDFISLRVVRKGQDGLVGLQGHASESFDLQTQFIVDNDKSFEDLYNIVDGIIKKETDLEKI